MNNRHRLKGSPMSAVVLIYLQSIIITTERADGMHSPLRAFYQQSLQTHQDFFRLHIPLYYRRCDYIRAKDPLV